MKRLYSVLPLIITFLVSCQKENGCESVTYVEINTRSIDSHVNSLSIISKEEALHIVEPISKKYPDRWIDVSDTLIPAGTMIAYNSVGHELDVEDCDYFLSPNYDSWLLVIENDVSVTGTQHHIHIFVNVESGEYSAVNINGRALVKWDLSRNVCVSSNHFRDNGESMRMRVPERGNGPSKWAVIISGGCDSQNNYSRYYKDCVNIYSKLTDVLGYPKDNIFCLISDGTDPTPDQRINSNTYISSNPDLDDDGELDVLYAASLANITTVFNDLSLLVRPGDEVLVFMTDHGNPSGAFCLWGSETLSPTRLDAELDKLGSSVMIDVVMGQCYSGAFINPLSAPNRTIATACSATQPSWALGYEYNYFLHYWTERILSSSIGDDGYVSPHELFVGACVDIMHLVSQEPQYSSTPDTFGKTHSIAGESIPYISGSEYLSTNINSTLSIVNCPNTSVTWSKGHNVTLVSHTDSSAVVKGSINLPGRYCEESTSVSATFTVDGKTHTIVHRIDSVWKPGMCYDGNNIWGSNGCYQVRRIGGEYGYFWTVDNSAWEIVGYNDNTVNLLENYAAKPVNLYVSFYDPLGEMIIVKDCVH